MRLIITRNGRLKTTSRSSITLRPWQQESAENEEHSSMDGSDSASAVYVLEVLFQKAGVSRWSARTHYLCIRQHVHLCEICQAVGCNQAGRLSPGRQVVGTRILYVHGIEAIGGAERDLIALLKTLDRQKWEPHVVCPGTGPFREQLHAIAVPTHALSLPPWRKPLAVFQRRSAVGRLEALVNRLDPATDSCERHLVGAPYCEGGREAVWLSPCRSWPM